MTELTKSELIVMKSIWEMGDGVTKAEIERHIENRYHKGWRPTTVGTFLSRLKDKRYVEFVRNGRECSYRILVSEKEYQEFQMKEMFEFWGTRKVGDTLASFFKEQGLEEDAAKKVKDLINELDF